MAGQLFNLKRYFGLRPDEGGIPNNQPNPGQFQPINMPMQQNPNPYAQQPYPPQAFNQQPYPPQAPMQAPQMPVENPVLAPPMDPMKRQDLSLLTHFSQRLNTAITQAAAEATRTRSSFIEPEHLLFGLLFD